MVRLTVDMPMPEACVECRFCTNLYKCAVNDAEMEADFQHQRAPWCPLEEEADSQRKTVSRMTFEEVIETLKRFKTFVHTDDLDSTIRAAKEHEAIDFAVEMLGMLENREKHFAEWAKRNDAHVCAACVRKSEYQDEGITRCPVEQWYSLPLDGYCHLWEGVKKDA